MSEKHSLRVKGVQLGPQKGILSAKGESFFSDKCVVIGWGPNRDSMMGLKHSPKAIVETFKRFSFLCSFPRLGPARIMGRPKTFPTTNKLAQMEKFTATKKHPSNKIKQNCINF